MFRTNFIERTDSYKLTHWDMLPAETTRVYSYLEARNGGLYGQTRFFGLQYLLKEYFEGQVFDEKDINQAEELCDVHFGRKGQFNRRMWEHILHTYGGRLPLRIRAVGEGSVIPVSNVLLTVENTDSKCPSLTNAVESILLKVWYPTTVATISYHVRERLKEYFSKAAENEESPMFSLHDFGYRGVSSEESAMVGGAAHLLNFRGTDTVPTLRFLMEYYGAKLDSIGYSVAASEHQIMTARGPKGELDTARRIIAHHPNQIVSLVADSYNYPEFVKAMCREQEHVNKYQVKLVIRPDSVTKEHETPESLVYWTLNYLKNNLSGVKTNSKGFTVLPYSVLWGDGIGPEGIMKIVQAAVGGGFSPANLVFGMGGGLLQKLNRDTCRFAFKCSAMEMDGQWVDVQKNPLDESKKSKAGRLALRRLVNGELGTLREEEYKEWPNLLQPVFENGIILKQDNWDTIRNRA